MTATDHHRTAPGGLRRVERWAADLALSPLCVFAALVLLTSDYYMSVVLELYDFPSAVAAARDLAGLEPAWLFAILTILTQATGTVLIFASRRWAWLGAGILAGFTLVAAVLGHAFWAAPAEHRIETFHSFLDHLGLIGGFMLVAYWSLRPTLQDPSTRNPSFEVST